MTQLWIEKYRPRVIEDCVLPSGTKDLFRRVVSEPGPPMNMLFHGSPGVGKTTVLRAIANEKELDLYFVNMSMKGNIDTLRTEIQQFASTVSLTGNGKLVGGDEFDYSNPQSTQPALRAMLEEFHDSCRFIFTCNFPKRIIEPLLSRLVLVDFSIPADEREAVAFEFMKRLRFVLDSEGVEYDKEALASLIIDRFPNYRKMLNDCQRAYNEVGRVDHSVTKFGVDDSFTELVGFMRARKYTDVRKWIGRNTDIDTAVLFRKFYDAADDLVTKGSVPQMVLHLGEYQHKAAYVADHEINLASCFAELMADMEWR